MSTVYINPPILYIPTEITPISVPLVAGKTATMNTTDMTLESPSTSWFSIRSVTTEAISDGSYLIKIVVDANAKNLPRLPKLCIGDAQIGGISALHFDANDNFDFGEFLFTINANSEKEALIMAASSSLSISDALIRVDSSNLEVSSSTKLLSVLVSE